MAEFIGVSVSDDLCQAINDKCDFKNMVKDKEYDREEAEKIFRGGFAMYRKGKSINRNKPIGLSHSYHFDDSTFILGESGIIIHFFFFIFR